MLLCCSGNQFIVNEAHNERLVKDNSDIFNSASAPPHCFNETALSNPYFYSFKMIEERDIINFQDYLYWYNISKNKILSENFIREFQEKS